MDEVIPDEEIPDFQVICPVCYAPKGQRCGTWENLPYSCARRSEAAKREIYNRDKAFIRDICFFVIIITMAIGGIVFAVKH